MSCQLLKMKLLDSTKTSRAMSPLFSVDEMDKREDLENLVEEVDCKKCNDLKTDDNNFNVCPLETDQLSELENHLSINKDDSIVQNIALLKQKYKKNRKSLSKRTSLLVSVKNKGLANKNNKSVLSKDKKEVQQNESVTDIQYENITNDLVPCKLYETGSENTEECINHTNKEMKINNMQEQLNCMICSVVFKSKLHFDWHIKGHVRNNCKLCSAKFAKRKALCKHLKEKHNIIEPTKLYSCNFCEKQFRKRQSLLAHLKIHANGKFLCLKCGFMCTDEEEYVNHGETHVEEYECSLCGKKFKRRQQHDQHLMGHKHHSCSHCTATFSTKEMLCKHQQAIHGIDVIKNHACSICKKKFEREYHLRLHSRKHTGESPFKCLQCEICFKTRKSLMSHMKTATHLKNVNNGKKVEVEKTFLCSFCGVKFFKKQSLSRHVDVFHTTGEPLKCPHCDYSTKIKANLKRHVERHSDVKRYVCEICGASFRALATLREHQSFVHSENRSFPCDTCSKSFKNKSSLQRHSRIHREDRPFKCHCCNTSFKRLSHLKRHMVAAHRMSIKRSLDRKSLEINNLETSSNSATNSIVVASKIEAQDQDSGNVARLQVQGFSPKNSLEQDLSKCKPISLSSKDSVEVNDYNYVLYTNVEDFLNTPEAVTEPEKIPLPPVTVHSNYVSTSDAHLNLSPNSYFSLSLLDSPMSTVITGNGSSEMQLQSGQDIISLPSVQESINRPRSLPNLNFQTSSDDSLFPFLIRNSDLSPNPHFLHNSDVPSPPVLPNKQLFAESGDILSLVSFGKSNDSRNSELWDTDVNSSQTSAKDTTSLR